MVATGPSLSPTRTRSDQHEAGPGRCKGAGHDGMTISVTAAISLYAIHRRRIAEAEDPEAEREALISDYREKFNTPMSPLR